MAVPKQRKTKSRQGNRRSHLGLDKKHLTECSNCGKNKLPHRVCDFCGYYKGEQVIDVMEGLEEEEKEERQEEIEQASPDEGGMSLEGLSRK